MFDLENEKKSEADEPTRNRVIRAVGVDEAITLSQRVERTDVRRPRNPIFAPSVPQSGM
jgi:hypothetical protein